MGRVIIIAFGIMLMTMILVQSILLIIPFIKRVEFDNLCYQYSAKLIREGEFVESEIAEMNEDLNLLGFKNSSCNFPKNIEDSFIVKVRAFYPMKYIANDFTTRELMLPYKFNMASIERLKFIAQ